MEHSDYSGGLQNLKERLRRLDADIPVPGSVKAPQLLARMAGLESKPMLRVVRPRWQKGLGVAAAFVLILGGVWLTRDFGGLNAPQTAAGNDLAQSSAAADTAGAEFSLKMADGFAQDYDQVRERLLAVQTELKNGRDAGDGEPDAIMATPEMEGVAPEQAVPFAAPADEPVIDDEIAAHPVHPQAAPRSTLRGAENGQPGEEATEAPAPRSAPAAGAGGVNQGGVAQGKNQESGGTELNASPATAQAEAGAGEPVEGDAPMTASAPQNQPAQGAQATDGSAVGGAPQLQGAQAPGAAVAVNTVPLENGLSSTDGETVCTLVAIEESGALAVQVAGVDGVEASLIELTDVKKVSSLYLHGGMLGVLYSGIWEETGAASTMLGIYDVTNTAEPRGVRTFAQQGTPVLTWMDGAQVYLITDYYILADAADSAVPSSALVPLVRDTAGGEAALPLAAGDVYLPAGAAADRYAVVSSITLTGAKQASTKAVLGGVNTACQAGGQIFMTGSFAGKGDTGLLRFTAKGDRLELAAQGVLTGVRPSQVSGMGALDGGVYVAAFVPGEDKNANMAHVYVLDETFVAKDAPREVTLAGKLRRVRAQGNTVYLTDESGAEHAVDCAAGKQQQEAPME